MAIYQLSSRWKLRPPASALIVAATLLAGSLARGGDPPPTTLIDPAKVLADIRHVTAERNRQFESLFVRYQITSALTGNPVDAKLYLRIAFLVDEEKTLAFKGENKRYSKLWRSSCTAADIAPDVKVPERPDAEKQSVKAPLGPIPRPDKKKGAPIKQGQVPVPGRIRLEQELTRAYDGHKIQQWHGDDQRTHLFDEKVITDQEHDKRYFNYEYLMTAFCSVPDAFKSEVTNGQLRLPDALDSALVTVRPHLEPVAGAACVVLEIGPSYVLWCDPALGYAVRRWDYRTPKTRYVTHRYELDEFKNVSPGMWLPQLASYTFFAPENAPELVKEKLSVKWTLRTKELHANDVPDSLFTLPLPTGSLVVDHIKSVRSKEGFDLAPMYTVPADGSQLEKVAQEAHDELSDKVHGKWGRAWHWTQGRYLTIMAFGAAVLVLMGHRLVLRYRRRAQSALSSLPSGNRSRRSLGK